MEWVERDQFIACKQKTPKAAEKSRLHLRVCLNFKLAGENDQRKVLRKRFLRG